VNVHLVDGTYELFRHHFGVPEPARSEEGTTAAVRGVVGFVLYLLENGATHLGVATDHVIESFRNDLWPGYKSSAGVPAPLLAQFPLLEEALATMGVHVWPMVDLEADDALASAAAVAAEDPRVDLVLIVTPDKDLGQCVVDATVVQLERRRSKDGRTGWTVVDEEGVVARFGVRPASIPDYLALVGDSADGFPGLPGWGPKSAAAVLARYGRLDDIPAAGRQWEVDVRGCMKLAHTLATQQDAVRLFRDLATLRVDRSLLDDVEQLRWRGPRPEFEAMCRRLKAEPLLERSVAAAAGRRD
jgi:5'-3' exonuclease